MSVEVLFLSNGMTVIANARFTADDKELDLEHPMELFLTPEDGKLQVSMCPAFTLMGVLPKVAVSVIEASAVVSRRPPTPDLLEHYQKSIAEAK